MPYHFDVQYMHLAVSSIFMAINYIYSDRSKKFQCLKLGLSFLSLLMKQILISDQPSI